MIGISRTIAVFSTRISIIYVVVRCEIKADCLCKLKYNAIIFFRCRYESQRTKDVEYLFAFFVLMHVQERFFELRFQGVVKVLADTQCIFRHIRRSCQYDQLL